MKAAPAKPRASLPPRWPPTVSRTSSSGWRPSPESPSSRAVFGAKAHPLTDRKLLDAPVRRDAVLLGVPELLAENVREVRPARKRRGPASELFVEVPELLGRRIRGKQPAVVVSRDVEMLLLSDTYMRRWAPLTLRQRCEKIYRKWRVRVYHQRLRRLYLRHDVRFRKTYKCFRGEAQNQERLIGERISFATKLALLQRSNQDIIYMDETVSNP